MNNFKKQFENLHVQLNVLDGAMSQTTATNAPQDADKALQQLSKIDSKRMKVEKERKKPYQIPVIHNFNVLSILYVAWVRV